MTIGECLKDIRLKKRLTQKELGELLGVGVQTISSYESGRRRPKMETLVRFAEALGVSVGEILTNADVIPNETNPENSYISGLSYMKIATLSNELKRLQENGAGDEISFVQEQLDKAKADVQDNVLLSVFHTLSDLNKQKAISYCEGLAAQQPGYEFADSAQYLPGGANNQEEPPKPQKGPGGGPRRVRKKK